MEEMDDVQNVLIIGSGTMGQQIGLLCAGYGCRVNFYDIGEDILDVAKNRIMRNAERMVEKGRFTVERQKDALQNLHFTTDPEKASRNVQIVSESIPEDPELKGKTFKLFNDFCDPATVFTTNTSSLLPSMFAEASGRPDRLCALHFHDTVFSNVVDIMPHPGTSLQTLDIVKKFATKIGQVSIVLKREHNGYVFNNMLMAVLDSALKLAEKDVASIEDIDKSWMGVLHTAVGPFGIMDSIGLDTVHKITDYWAKIRGDKQALRNAAFLNKYLKEGKTGIKSGEGFYRYSKSRLSDV